MLGALSGCLRRSWIAVLLAACHAGAQSITIQDASFDVRSLSSGGWSNTITPWQETGGPGSSNGFVEYISGFSADGLNHLGMALNHNVWQDLAVTYQANTRYTLTVAVGNRSGQTQAGNQSQYLLADSTGTVYATGTHNASTVSVGSFSDAPALMLDTAVTPSAVGKTIRVLLQARGAGRSHFDKIRLTAVALGPEIAVEQPAGTNLVDGTASVAFGNVPLGDAVERIFTVRNVGTEPLAGLAVTADGTHAADFGIATLPAVTLAPGATTTFTIRFTPGAIGGRTAFLRIASNDGNENPFDIALGGSGFIPAPEIVVEQPAGTGLTDGLAAVAFGNIWMGSNASLTFTVRNTGTGALSNLSVAIDGPHAGDFTVVTAPAATLAPNASTTFSVRLTPSASGIRTATLHLGSNDADENPFDIALAGNGVTRPGTVAMFNRTSAGSIGAYCSANTKTALENLGYIVKTFADTAAADWNGAFTGADAVVVPASVEGLSLSPESVVIINRHLAEGKGLVTMGMTAIPFLNTLRGWQLVLGSNLWVGIMIDKQAGGAEFITSPAVLGAQDSTWGMKTASLPGGTVGVYEYGTSTAVFRNGSVAYLGFDWWNSQNSQQWNLVLSDALRLVVDPREGAEILVEEPSGLPLADGSGQIGFGISGPGVGITRTLTVRNIGDQPLGPLVTAIDGPGSGDFLITPPPQAILAPDETTTLVVTFAPQATGLRRATLRIASNDTNENPFDVSLAGFGYDEAVHRDFRIVTLGSTGSAVTDHQAITGDDCGGIAVSPGRVFITGDGATAAFDHELAGGVSTGRQIKAPCADFGAGVMFALANNGVEIASAGQVNQLLVLDPETGQSTGVPIALSQTITMESMCGVFSGNGRIVLHSGTRVWDILLPSGLVSDLGPMARPAWYESESFAIWGVAESFGGHLYLCYRTANENRIVRHRVTDGLVETIASFTNLGDLANWSIWPTSNRWYFHHEMGSQFGGTGETMGYADATFAMGPPTEPPSFESGLTTITHKGAPFRYRVSAGNSPLSFGAVGLPDGLAIHPTTGLITGSATESGVFMVRLSATNAAGTSEVVLELMVRATSNALADDFDPGIDNSVWQAFGGTVTANTNAAAAGPGSTGNSLHFDGTGIRHATTVPVDTRGIAAIAFRFALANGNSPVWEYAESGEEVRLEYSLDGTDFTTFGPALVTRNWQPHAVELPAGAKAAAVWFRWRQLSHSGAANDHWALDDVRIDSSVAVIPDILVEQPANIPLESGGSTVAFGAVTVAYDKTATFTVRNTGATALTNLAATVVGPAAADFSVTTGPSSTVSPGGSTTFVVRFTPTAVGERGVVLRVLSNDPDESPFDINLTGIGRAPAPDILIEQPAGSGLADGQGFVNCGATSVGTPLAVNFIIRNTGTGPLAISGIALDGPHAGDLVVISQPAATVAVGATTTLTLRFQPIGVGVRRASLHVGSDDPDESPFDIELRGIGGTATTATLNATYRGWYESNGNHTRGNDNYITGWSQDGTWREYRSFYNFTIPALAAGESIVAAELRLANPAQGFASPDKEEILRIAEVTTSPDVLAAGTGGLAAFQDLADGRVFNAPLVATTATASQTVVVPLNDSFLTMANARAGTAFALGGSLATLRPEGGALENLLGWSNSSPATTLVITKVANAAPVFTGYAASTPWQTPAMVSFVKMLRFASDADGDKVAVTGVSATSANGGTLVMHPSGILYTPPADFSGMDAFSVSVTDSKFSSATGTISITVGHSPAVGGAATNPPKLTTLPGGKIGLSFQGIPGRSYVVQRSAGGLDDWQTLATVTADATGKISFTDENPPPGSAFYRLGIP